MATVQGNGQYFEFGGNRVLFKDAAGREMIAPEETSSTASRAYAVGELFIYNDLLYRATAAIAQGGTITPGTNCENVPGGIGGEVGELKSALYAAEDNIYIKQSDTTIWESGAINGATGIDAVNGKRIRTNAALASSILAFTVLDGYSALIFGFDGDTYVGVYNDGVFVKSSSPSQLKYYTGTVKIYELPQEYSYRLVAKNTSDTSISVSAAENILLWTSADKEQDAEITAIETALQQIAASEIVHIPSHANALGTALTYRIPQKIFAGETYINDTTETDGIAANITQGICSDGVRYLYYNLAPMGDNLGREVSQRIRKWDTWTNTSAGLSEPGDWGHCEDICFVPAWCPGFDNGNVDRLYTTDFNYSVGTPEGYYIHVINANTLEYLTSFRTDTLVGSEYWVGAMHLVFNQERGLFCMKCAKTIDTTKYWCFAVFDSSGALLRAARVRYIGTGIGFDCDQNYIYPVRYSSGYIFGYVIDWNLNPIARFRLDQADWEIEGICHIGLDIYISYNQEKISGKERKNTIVKTKPIYDFYDASGNPLTTWPTSDGVHRSEWTMIEIS